MHGQGSYWMLAEKIQWMRLVLTVPDHPIFQISCNEKIQAYGIAQKVDVEELGAFARQALPTTHFERVPARMTT